jgi:para-nitrobenzyl esterase
MASHHLEIATGHIEVPQVDREGVRVFKGLPYASPPVGSLRWKPPQPLGKWDGVRPVNAFGPNAPQRVLFDDIDPFKDGISEDCLYLNVWTPAETGAALPVFFWIHGGGFAVGAGSEPRYDGGNLAKHGVVVVTVNTRLNALGFLAHPALTAETGTSGNFAIQDLVMALRWVKSNITQFGGDPNAVTIGGESAGSMFVSLLMSSPKAKGLFHRAIGQSGAWFPSIERPMHSLAQAEKKGLAFAAKLGAKTAEELRSIPVEKILDGNPGLGFWPITDGHIIPTHPPEIFDKAQQSDVPLLAGWNKDEGFNFDISNWDNFKGKAFKDSVATLFPNDAAKVFQHYESPRELGGDLVINNSTWAWLEAHRKTAMSDIFRYRFDRAPKTPEGWFPAGANAGAFHSCEILYAFDNLSAFPWLTDQYDQQVATLMSSYWLNFIKSGNPNGTALPNWPSNRDDKRPLMVIDAKPHVLMDVDKERHQMLAGIISTGK